MNCAIARRTGEVKNPYVTESEWGWSMDPTGFRYLLNFLADCHRVRKDSFWWYQKVCRSNGEELE